MDNILDEKGEISFNINDYNITFENGICTIKRKYNSLTSVKDIEFKNSDIIQCYIKNGDKLVSDKTKYSSILADIYNEVDLEYLMKKYSKLKSYNFDAEERIKNFSWNEIHKFAWRSKDSNNTIKDIIDIVKDNDFRMLLHIILENGKELKYNV